MSNLLSGEEKYLDELLEICVKLDIDPALVRAICQVESGGISGRVRFEPEYRYLVSPSHWALNNGITVQTEIVMQKTSWGLMQLMGSNFRALGFAGQWPEVGYLIGLQLNYSCTFLKGLLKRYGRDEAIASYNAGSPRRDKSGKLVNQIYVDKVMKYFFQIKG